MQKPDCSHAVWSANSNEELMTETIAEMRSFDVVGVLGYDPEPVGCWSEAAPELFIPAVRFAIGSRYHHSIERLRELASEGRLRVFGGVENGPNLHFAGCLECSNHSGACGERRVDQGLPPACPFRCSTLASCFCELQTINSPCRYPPCMLLKSNRRTQVSTLHPIPFVRVSPPSRSVLFQP